MALDPLAHRLERLLRDGSVVASELSQPMRERLATLFQLGALVEVRAGGGKRVQVADRAAVESWIATAYPSGLTGTTAALPSGAEALANFAHSKRGRKIASRPVFMRGLRAAELRRGGNQRP